MSHLCTILVMWTGDELAQYLESAWHAPMQMPYGKKLSPTIPISTRRIWLTGLSLLARLHVPSIFMLWPSYHTKHGAKVQELLVAHQLIYYRQNVRSHRALGIRMTICGGGCYSVLLILIESGIIYCFLLVRVMLFLGLGGYITQCLYSGHGCCVFLHTEPRSVHCQRRAQSNDGESHQVF